MNPFASLISQVTTHRPAQPPARVYTHRADLEHSKAEAMRKYLMQHGEATAADLAAAAGLKNTGLVYALLKWDISKGRIDRCGKFWRLAA